MPFKPGHKKIEGSGRKKGQVSRDRKMLMDKAEALGIDPFEILLHIANGDWERLGYDAPGVVKRDKYCEWLELTISTDTRARAAADACQYMLPKLKALEIDMMIGNQGPLLLNLNLAGGNATSLPEPQRVDSTPVEAHKIN